MQSISRPRSHRAVSMGLAPTAISLIAGCQSYQSAPLDLTEYHNQVQARLDNTEPIDAFLERLKSNAIPTPHRFDPSDGLTLAEGEALALFYNPDLRIARLKAGVAHATFKHAALWQDPVFGFDGAHILSPSSALEYGLTLSLTIPISGTLDAEKDRAGAAYDSQLYRIIDAEWTTRSALRRAWTTWSAAEQRAAILDETLKHIDHITSITSELEEVGELSRIEARLFRVERAARRAEHRQATQDAHRAKLELHALMGLAPDTSTSLIPDTSSPNTTTSLSSEDLVDTNTRLAIARAEYETAEQTLRREIREQYPDITIGPGYGDENDTRFLFGVALPIPILNTNKGGIAEARAARNLSRAQAEATFSQLAQQLALATSSLKSIRAQRTDYELSIIPMLAEQSNEIDRITELGEVNTLLLLEAVTRELEAKSRLLELIVAEHNAAITIEHLLGPPHNAPAPVSDPNGGAQ